MKKQENSFLQDVMKQLSLHGPITFKAMFGGYGVYYNAIIFAIIVEEELYFRVDESNLSDYEAFASHSFVYMGKNKPIEMPYWLLPKEILEDAKQLPSWIQKAYEASLHNRSKKKHFRSGKFHNKPTI